MKNIMYRKMGTLFICLLCIVLATGCSSANRMQGNVPNQDEAHITDNNDDASIVQNGNNTEIDSLGKNNANTENPQAVAQPAPPIQAESFNEIVSLLVKADTQGYNELIQLKYEELFSQFKNNGYIYQVVTSDNMMAQDAITLFEREGKNMFFIMPCTQYEDSGIVSYVLFHGEIYQVNIYNVDEKSIPQADSISEYIQTRLSVVASDEMTIGKASVCFFTEGDGKDYLKKCAAAFIDSKYYYVLKTETSHNELNEFIRLINFEKMTIE